VILDESSSWSFRQRARAWIGAVSRPEGDVRSRAFDASGQRVLLLETARLSGRQSIDSFLLANGDFSCDEGCRFSRPVYVAGNCVIGKRSVLDYIEADGSLHLAPSVHVHRRADSIGPMEIRSGCRIDGSAYSRSAIRLGFQASASDLYAPKVITPSGIRSPATRLGKPKTRAVKLERPGKPRQSAELLSAGIDPGKLRTLETGAWLYSGDLYLQRPLYLAADLVVDGGFSCQPCSLLDGRLDVRGSVQLGEETVARQRISAGGDLNLEPRCVFQGDLFARQMMRLASGARGLSEGRPVTAQANGEVIVEENVAVRGRLVSSCRVIALATEAFSARLPRTSAAAQ
jgi:hypothetical protein